MDIKEIQSLAVIPTIAGLAGGGYAMFKYTPANGLIKGAFNQASLDEYKRLIGDYKDLEAVIYKNTLEIYQLKKELQAAEDQFFRLHPDRWKAVMYTKEEKAELARAQALQNEINKTRSSRAIDQKGMHVRERYTFKRNTYLAEKIEGDYFKIEKSINSLRNKYIDELEQVLCDIEDAMKKTDAGRFLMKGKRLKNLYLFIAVVPLALAYAAGYAIDVVNSVIRFFTGPSQRPIARPAAEESEN